MQFLRSRVKLYNTNLPHTKPREEAVNKSNQSHTAAFTDEGLRLRHGIAEATALLDDAARQLCATMQDELMRTETPMEVQATIEIAAERIAEAIRRLQSIGSERPPSATLPGRPTRQQGQFLAFIREYMMRNEAGVAPTHADFQRVFNLTPPSVNSMLIRLEKRRFIRRVPGKARAIQLVINPDWIPPLDLPFKL